MRTIRKNYKSILICSFLIGLFVLAGLMIKPAQANQTQSSHWLAQYESRIIEVTFLVQPPERKQVEKVRLARVLSNGIIVRYDSPNEIFYPFSSILSVDP